MTNRLISFALLIAAALTARAEERPLDFARHIQPILAAKCAKCHGNAEHKGGIAFHARERAVAKGESGETAIVPGKPEASEMLRRITSSDESTRMPPEGKPLNEKEIELIRRWIREGANWSEHWSYRPIAKQPVPSVKHSERVTNEVDAFIERDLEAAGLDPLPQADKATLVRRVYYDLTGLPPTPEQAAEFVNDASPNAWEKLVDRLLASPHYGEHWARKWLDVVRYAETNSFERDNPKPHVWRYRDYVIRAFNDDKPYDQFLREQLAGDEFERPSADAIIATGFYRLGVWDDEPADRELAVYDGYDDLVTTIGQGMLGLTFNCARCHDHKIDPISQGDYYGLVAFLRNIEPMAGGGPNIESELFAKPDDLAEFQAAERDRLEELKVAQEEVKRLEEIFLIMTAKKEESVASGKDLRDVSFRYYKQSFDLLPDFSKLKPTQEGKLPSNVLDWRKFPDENEFAYVFEATLLVPADGEYEFHLDSDDGSRLAIEGKTILTYDGIHGTGSEKHAKVTLKKGEVPLRLEYFQRHNGLGLSLAWNGPGFERRSFTPSSAGAKEPSKKRDRLAERIKQNGLEVLGQDEFAKYTEALKRAEVLKKEPVVERALCVKERDTNAPETFILLRGTPGNHGAKVEPVYPKLFGSAPPKIDPIGSRSSGRRTALANWIASPDNKLTSRVLVNRVWQGLMGRGIVRSPNNFGGLGAPPTHPELLDWLAGDFTAGGWKIKRLQKTILMSSAYRRASSGANAKAELNDPANDLFWRHDLRRLSAEEVRDSMLFVNGRFNPAMFGPSIYPEIQAEVLAGQSVPGRGWGKSSPEEQSRRAVYVHVKRSLITPILASFDFPETDTSCEARFTTVQPGQSFAMLNGKFANEQAAALAARVEKEGGDDSAKIARAIELALARKATPAEIERGRALIANLIEKHKLDRARAWHQYCLYVYNLNEFLHVD